MNEPNAGETRNARTGMMLFVVYVLFYAGFVMLSAFAPEQMKRDVLGVNLAIAYGFGLIVLAFLMALLYMFLTRNNADLPVSGSGTNGEGR